MNNYTTIPKDIVDYKCNSKLLDIYTFACIRSSMNYKNGESKINIETLSNRFNLSERTLHDAIQRLEE